MNVLRASYAGYRPFSRCRMARNDIAAELRRSMESAPDCIGAAALPLPLLAPPHRGGDAWHGSFGAGYGAGYSGNSGEPLEGQGVGLLLLRASFDGDLMLQPCRHVGLDAGRAAALQLATSAPSLLVARAAEPPPGYPASSAQRLAAQLRLAAGDAAASASTTPPAEPPPAHANGAAQPASGQQRQQAAAVAQLLASPMQAAGALQAADTLHAAEVLVKTAGWLVDDAVEPVVAVDLSLDKRGRKITGNAQQQRQLHLQSHAHVLWAVLAGVFPAPHGRATANAGTTDARRQQQHRQQQPARFDADATASARRRSLDGGMRAGPPARVGYRLVAWEADSDAVGGGDSGHGRRPSGTARLFSLQPGSVPPAAAAGSGSGTDGRAAAHAQWKWVQGAVSRATAPLAVAELAYAAEAAVRSAGDTHAVAGAAMAPSRHLPGPRGAAKQLSDKDKRAQSAQQLAALCGPSLGRGSPVPLEDFGGTQDMDVEAPDAANADATIAASDAVVAAAAAVEPIDRLAALRSAAAAAQAACRPGMPPARACGGRGQPAAAPQPSCQQLTLRCLDWQRPGLMYDVAANKLGVADDTQVRRACKRWVGHTRRCSVLERVRCQCCL